MHLLLSEGTLPADVLPHISQRKEKDGWFHFPPPSLLTPGHPYVHLCALSWNHGSVLFSHTNTNSGSQDSLSTLIPPLFVNILFCDSALFLCVDFSLSFQPTNVLQHPHLKAKQHAPLLNAGLSPAATLLLRSLYTKRH